MKKIERIFHALFTHRHGLTCDELVNLVYVYVYVDADGGPLAAVKTVQVLVYHLNKHHLRPLGWQIVADHGGYGAKRRLVKL